MSDTPMTPDELEAHGYPRDYHEQKQRRFALPPLADSPEAMAGIAPDGEIRALSRFRGFRKLRAGRVHLRCYNCGRKYSNMARGEDLPAPVALVESLCPNCANKTGAKDPPEYFFDIDGEPMEPTPPPSETKLSEALDDFESSAKVLGCVEFQWQRDDVVPTYEMENAQKSVNAARSSLESLYREQADKLRESDQTIKAMNAEAGRLEDELSALRSLQLTPAEARLVLHALETNGYAVSITNPIVEKLRISSKATSEEL